MGGHSNWRTSHGRTRQLEDTPWEDTEKTQQVGDTPREDITIRGHGNWKAI